MNSNPYHEDRGQFITLTAVVLAVVIVGGVGVAYAGMSSYEDRKTSVSVQSDVDDELADTNDLLEDSITDINHDPTISGLPDRKSVFADVVDSTQKSSVLDRKYTNISESNIKYTSGTRVVNSDPTSTLSAGGSENWTVMSSAQDTKQIMLQIDSTQLPTASGDPTEITIYTNSGAESVKIHTNPAGDEIVLNDTAGGSCAASQEIDSGVNKNVSINLIDGIIKTRSNPFFGVLRGDVKTAGDQVTQCGDYQIESAINRVDIQQGNSTVGAMSVTFRGGNAGANVPTAPSPPAYGDSGTTATDIIYAATLDVTVASEGTSVTHPIVVSPGVNHKPPS